MNGHHQPRILQVLEATLGGTRRYLADVLKALGAGPHNGLVYSLHRADAAFFDLLDEFRRAGWKLFEVDMHRSINPQHDARCVLELRTIYRSFSPDIVHAHSSKAGAIARLATVGMRRRPGIVYSPHSIGVNMGWIYKPIEQLLALQLDVLTADTPSEREELRSLKLTAPGRVHVVVPTIRAEEFAPLDRAEARRALQLPDGPLVIGVGRLTQQKDPLTFVRFVAALRARVPNVRAIWVGEGILRAAMETCIAELGLTSTLTITGWLEDVRPYVAACDLLVSTAGYESFGYVAAEALAMDRPVVASAITGTVDVITTDVPEQLYAYGDFATAARLAERLLGDAVRAAEVAHRGRTSVLSTYSIGEMRRGLASAYAAAARR